jgi:lysophospholipase
MAASETIRRSIPAGATISYWNAPDGWPLRRFDWPAAVERPRGSILFQPGRGDIFEKYLETFNHWHAAGWSITSFDWRGQGGSGRLTASPITGDIDHFDTYLADFRAFWAQWAPTVAGPKVVMGHSMGGHLVLRALVQRLAEPDAAVLIAPMLGLYSPVGARAGERVAKIAASIGDPGRLAWKANERPGTTETRESLLTHDTDRYLDEIWWRDHVPELQMGPPSWRWVHRAFESTRLLRDSRDLAAMTVPTLMLLADADKLVSAKAALAIAAKLPDIRVVRFCKESAHEILREADPVRNRAIGEIDTFLGARAQHP